LRESTMNTKLPSHRFHLALHISLFDTPLAQTGLMAKVPDVTYQLLYERCEELILPLEAAGQYALYRGEETICQVISRQPQGHRPGRGIQLGAGPPAADVPGPQLSHAPGSEILY